MADITVSADIHSFLQAASDSAARTALGVDAAGTDNSTGVTLAGTGTYISIAGQVITVDGITESDITDLGTYLTDLTGDALSTVSDVTITSIASGEILAWNGSAWINQTLAEAGISATGHTHTASDITDFDTEVGNNTAVAANTAKTGITAQQASDITANNAKVTYDAAAAVALNTAKVTNATHTGDVTGATVLTIAAGAVDLAMLSATGTPSGTTFLRGDNTWATPAAGGDATSIQGTDVDGSVGSPSDGDILVYRSAGSDFVLESKPAAGSNPAASDITDATADGIALITSSDANPFTDADESKLDGISAGAEVNAIDSVNTQTGAVVLDADDISDAATTNKFTTASDISKLAGIETGATADQDLSSYQLQPSEGAFANGDKTKLDGIEASADVTDATNVTASGALMDSEVSNLSQVKAFDSSDYATAAQGTKADAAQQPPSEGAFANGDKTKLDGIETSADVTDTANVTSAGALMDSEVTNLAQVKAFSSADYATAAQGATADSALQSESDTLDSVTGRGATTTNGVTVGSIDISGDIDVDGTANLDVVDIDGAVDMASTLAVAGKVSVGTNAQFGAPVGQFNGTNIAILNTSGQFSVGSTNTAGADLGGSLGFTANTTSLTGYPMGNISGRLIATGAGVYRSYMAFATTNAGGTVAERMRLTDTGLDVSGNVEMATGNVTGKFAVGSAAVHPSIDFYNQGTAYFNGATTVDDDLSVTGEVAATSLDINGEIIEKAVNTTGVTGSTALDPANGTIQRLTFSGAVTFTDSLADGESITLIIDDGSGNLASWPTMEWVGGSAPTLDTTNEHIIVVWKVNSTLYGMASGVAS